MSLAKGTLIKGRYKIHKLLAQGGFGFVYLTLDRYTGRQVVLKELIPVLAGDPEVERRFVREGRAMQRLNHPHIARVWATFQEQGNLYIVLEYLAGGSLAERLDRLPGLSLDQAAPIVIALCDALVYMHGRGITHCDVNPTNVLFDAYGEPKLVDLGIAHVSDAFVHRAWQTVTSFAMGTVAYMAPEQLKGRRDDGRIDQYALAALIYRMLAGRHYLDLDLSGTPSAEAENVMRILRHAPAPIAGLDPEVNRVLLCALSKAPADRYPDMAAFQRTLVQVLLPYLPAELGLRLLAPFRYPTAKAAPEGKEWPRWVWGALCALHGAVMALVVWLLFRVNG